MSDDRKPELHAPHPETKEWRRWGYVRLDFPGEEEFYLWDDMTIRIYRYPENRPKTIVLRDLGPVESVNAELLAAIKGFRSKMDYFGIPLPGDMRPEIDKLASAIARAEAGAAEAAPEKLDPISELNGRIRAVNSLTQGDILSLADDLGKLEQRVKDLEDSKGKMP